MKKANDTDSLFTYNASAYTEIDEWTDIRLIHSSSRGWCNVYGATCCGRRVASKLSSRNYAESAISNTYARNMI